MTGHYFAKLDEAAYVHSADGCKIYTQCIRCLGKVHKAWVYNDLVFYWFCEQCTKLWDIEYADQENRIIMNQELKERFQRLTHDPAEYHRQVPKEPRDPLDVMHTRRNTKRIDHVVPEAPCFTPIREMKEDTKE